MWLGPRLQHQRAQCIGEKEDIFTMERQFQRQQQPQILVYPQSPSSPHPRCSPHTTRNPHRRQDPLDEITIDNEFPLATSTMSKKVSTGATRRGIDLAHVHHHQFNSSPVHHHPQLNFPPPPSYPPPNPRPRHYRYSVNESREAIALSEGGASASGSSGRSRNHDMSQDGAWGPHDEDKVILGPIEYSYAYYEPGPARRHSNIPHKYPGGDALVEEVHPVYDDDIDQQPSTSTGNGRQSFKGGSYRARHTYMTRYGTEENIYEEIGDIERARLLQKQMQQELTAQYLYQKRNRQTHSPYREDDFPEEDNPMEMLEHQQSMLSINQSIVEEEVRRVQSGHRRVLGELNLSVEAMLMPTSSSSREGSEEADKDGKELDDQLADLLTVGPTDELLSPVPMVDLDSGFSGSSSGASYRSVGGSLRRGCNYERTAMGCTTSMSAGNVNALARGSSPSGDKSNPSSSNSKSFWSRKGWKKLGFSNNGKQKNVKQPKKKSDPNLCSRSLRDSKSFIGNDEPRHRSGVWEDLGHHHSPRSHQMTSSASSTCDRRFGNTSNQPSAQSSPINNHNHTHPRTNHSNVPPAVSLLQQKHNLLSSQRSSEDSWCSGSEQEEEEEEGALFTEEDDEEDRSDRSATSSTRSGPNQLRNTLQNKARTLCEKWRGSTGGQKFSLDGAVSANSDHSPNHRMDQNQGRLSRWFSIRRGSSHQYDVEGTANNTISSTQHNGQHNGSGIVASPNTKMPLLPEVDEEAVFGLGGATQRRHLPPNLPPPPSDLSPQQLKRRMIVSAIVHSENSYVATLQRLVNDYKKPLEDSSPPILSSSKISTLFHRLPEILQCHTLFRIALADYVRNWDKEERIGDVFVASFSKAIVLDIYSDFINNFSAAMDLAKMEAKRKSALADFLKVKQISSHDRLSFFGLMVKPVQRFPQFILFLQDLLKHTPQGHHDRMSLQLALTQLESLAEMLNERKREAEQFQAFREMLRNISGKFTARPLSDGNRYLLREDNVTQLDFNQHGVITKEKRRRLLLLNDLVVCVSVQPKQSDDFGAGERLSLKWMCPVADVEIQDTSASPTLSRILTASINKGGSLRSNASFDGSSSTNNHSINSQGAENLCTEMSNLMHDYEVMSRIGELVGQLKGTYRDMTVENTKRILHQIQSSIQRKDEEIAWIDSCCLQLVVKSKGGRGEEVIHTFQTEGPHVKREWVTELRLAQLALDTNNSPAWEIPEQERRPSTKMPLFVKAQSVHNSQHQTEVRCGCFYTINNVNGKVHSKRSGRSKVQNYLWVCTTDGASSHIAILQQHGQQTGQLKDVGSFSLVETQVTAMEFVKGMPLPCSNIASDAVWMGTNSRRLLLYAADEPERQEELGSCIVPDVITQIRYHCDNVFIALGNGTVLMYHRDSNDGTWQLNSPKTVALSEVSEPVSCLLPINHSMYAACGRKVWVLNSLVGEIQRSFSVQHEQSGASVHLMAHSGIGLWISLKNSSTICLYHTETFKHLQDINIASNVMRVTTSGGDCLNNNQSQVNVTALMACKGLLWVGTNVGISLTIPLPRLEGVPIISGRVNISYHAHFGPITFLLALQPKTYHIGNTNDVGTTKRSSIKEVKLENHNNTSNNENNQNIHNENTDEKTHINRLEKQLSEPSPTQSINKLKHLTNSPIVVRRRRSKDGNLDSSRISKTLPRGLGCGGSVISTAGSTTSSQSSGDTCDVYGLYSDLMFVRDARDACYSAEDRVLISDHPVYETLRRSDPELAAIPGKVSTLDRRLRIKIGRPRSLDLSNWSVDSRSSSLYTSSGSEENMVMRGGRSVSRNSSDASRQFVINNNANSEASTATEGPQTISSSTATASSSNNNSNESNTNTRQVNISRTMSKAAGRNGCRNSTVLNEVNASRSRTVITLMGGRGYINWRQPCCLADKSKNSANSLRDSNSHDAHIVIWELKL